MKSNIPVIFFVYQRPEYTEQFLNIFLSSGIKKIYVFSDGSKFIAESSRVEKVRELINNFGDQHKDIQIIKKYSKKNLGLKKSIVDGLNSVFKIESSAIIIEDDCLPSNDFIKFASELLNRYKGNPNIMSITGTSVGVVSTYSYDFTSYQHCWGWATWARAWELYDPELKLFSSKNWRHFSKSKWTNPIMRLYWQIMLTLTKVGWLNTWDFQWSYAHFVNNGLAIYPMSNLITNVGFDSVATNTKTYSKVSGNITGDLSWPLNHPKIVRENNLLTKVMERKFYLNPIAFLGMIRQLAFYTWSKYAHRN